ncbi:MAG: cell division topological specificity factor MinE [Pleurocapsa sp. MO_192.B19]|nr:cell division topological specificity factor MinE [Pleurocapsa sp. MO_192.B19]
MIFPWNKDNNSRDHAKSRLKLIIAHDRASINPDILAAMREEILNVVARYVEVDREEMQFSLSNDQRMTSLTANLPIRQIKRLGELKQHLKENTLIDLQSLEVVEIEQGVDGANPQSL